VGGDQPRAAHRDGGAVAGLGDHDGRLDAVCTGPTAVPPAPSPTAATTPSSKRLSHRCVTSPRPCPSQCPYHRHEAHR